MNEEVITAAIEKQIKAGVKKALKERMAHLFPEMYVKPPSKGRALALEIMEEDKKNRAKEQMRHVKTDVPLVEGGKKFIGGAGGKQSLKEGGVVDKVKKAAKKVKEEAIKVGKKVKEVAVKVGKAAIVEAKKHSHHLIEAGKKAGGDLGTMGGEALAVSVGAPVEPSRRAGKIVGEKLGELAGRKAHEGIQSLKKGGRVKRGENLLVVTDTKPVEHKKSVAVKRTNTALKEVQAIRKAKGVSLKDAWAMYKSK